MIKSVFIQSACSGDDGSCPRPWGSLAGVGEPSAPRGGARPLCRSSVLQGAPEGHWVDFSEVFPERCVDKAIAAAYSHEVCKALAMVLPFVRVSATMVWVTSENPRTPQTRYAVELSQGPGHRPLQCQCKDHKYRKRRRPGGCKHMRQARLCDVTWQAAGVLLASGVTVDEIASAWHHHRRHGLHRCAICLRLITAAGLRAGGGLRVGDVGAPVSWQAPVEVAS